MRALLLALVLCAPAARSQASGHALRFYGTGTGQADRVRIPIDDDAPEPDASAPCDVGARNFTIELWLRGELEDNATPSAGGDVETSDDSWIEGNIFFDRDIFGGSENDFGLSLAGGFVRFGTGSGDSGADLAHTLEGDVQVLDGAWHHVACVRDSVTGVKRIYVDGQLDYQSPAGTSSANISYPNAGVPGQSTPYGPFIVLGAEKHDAGPEFPSFAGYLDELRIWDVVRTQAQILDSYERVISGETPGLVAYYRFEEGAGTLVQDASDAGSPDGELIAGVPGNGEWVAAASAPDNTAPVSTGSLPWGFTRTLLTTGLFQPTAIEFLPDGRLLVAQRGGEIRVFESGALAATPLVEIPVDTFGEHGLVALKRDPSFATNGWLYVYYTSVEPRNRLSRITVTGATASLASEVVLWENPDQPDDFHHGGGLAFGPDGMIYLSTGDQETSAWSQDLGSQHGKVLRLAPDGSVPSDNPFVGVPGVEAPIWAYGLRNPFRLTFDEVTGKLWIGDVGGNGRDAYEELDPGVAGANYGWPDQEGPACYVSSCAGMQFPTYSYLHGDPEYWVDFVQGAIVCGPVYNATAFPAPYRGNLFIGDYGNHWIRRVVFDASGAVVGDPVFVAAPDAGPVVDLEVGPDGALYWVTIGGTPDSPALWRVEYTSTLNFPPVLAADASPTSGLPPLEVAFSSLGTFDPDGGPEPLTYLWDFGDGGSATVGNPVHVYASTGQFTAVLGVSDGASTVFSQEIEITAGNAPLVTIAAPAALLPYQAGDEISYSGGATDVEDGVLPGAALSWQVMLVHAGHEHPFLGPHTGSGGSFTVPTSSHPPEDTHYEVHLTATDSDGLSSTVVHALSPVTSTLVLDTVPSGIPIFLDGQALSTPRVYESLVGFEHELAAQGSAMIGSTPHDFGCWSDGGAVAHSFPAPVGGMNLTANYDAADTAGFDLPVPASTRNAEHTVSAGQAFANAFDPFGLCFGAEAGAPYQAGLEFALGVPQGATIVQARLRVVATADQSGAASATVAAYDVADAPAFVAGTPTSLAAFAPLTSATAEWSPVGWVAGTSYASPDVAALVQEVVDRPDWQPGNHIGFVLDGSPTAGEAWSCLRNFASGTPARLVVQYSTGAPEACADPCGYTSYGLAASPNNVLGLVGIGTPSIGTVPELRTTGIGSGIGAWTSLALGPASFALFGGVILLNPAQSITYWFSPSSGGAASLPLFLPPDPTLVSARIYFQSVGLDLALPELFVFSGGLEMRICP